MKAPYVCTPLNTQQSRVLKLLAEGGKIEAQRYFPHGFHYWLFNKQGYRYASSVSETTIETLNDFELLKINGFHIGYDRYGYTASKTGIEAYARGSVLPPDQTQLSLLNETNA